MKRKARAELGTFSASAIDLFASALGAFIVITVLLFPYFPNLSPDPLQAIVEMLRGENQALQGQVDNLSDQNDDLQAQTAAQATTIQQQRDQITAAQRDADAAQATVQALTTSAGDRDRQIDDLQDQLTDLQGQLDGTAFIGVEPEANDFQIVLDMSGSIQGFRATVENVVQDVLSRMNADDNLRVVTYQGGVTSPTIQSWPAGTGFTNGVTDQVRTDAAAFVRRALDASGGGTPTFRAIESVLDISVPSTIILVTDGVPQVLASDPGAGAARSTIVSAVESATRRNNRRHQINIVAIGDFVSSEQSTAIVPLATRNGGVLVAMP